MRQNLVVGTTVIFKALALSRPILSSSRNVHVYLCMSPPHVTFSRSLFGPNKKMYLVLLSAPLSAVVKEFIVDRFFVSRMRDFNCPLESLT